MFQTFSFLNYSLILVALLSQYGIGRRLTSKPFISAVIVGLSFSGLIVAILANVLSGLIKPFIIVSIVLGGVLTIYDFYKTILKNDIKLKMIVRSITLVVLGIVFFLLNNPSKVHFERQGNTIKIPFDAHFTNYASLSIEMLDADYLTRLKHRNLYPKYWSVYHFFNSAVFSIAQGLISLPNLWTYFMVQTIIMILIFLAILEWFFCHAPPSIYRYILLAIWIGIVCTLFSIEWQFRTSGYFSFFALVFMSIGVLSKKYKEAIFFSILLGASVFRLFPVSLCIITFILIKLIGLKKCDLNINNLKRWISDNRWMSTYFVLFLLYNLITLIAPLFYNIGFWIEKLSSMYLACISDGFEGLLTVLLEPLSPRRIAFIYKANLIFQNYSHVIMLGGLFVFSCFSILLFGLYGLVKKKRGEFKIIYFWGGIFLSLLAIKKMLINFFSVISGNFNQLFFDFFNLYSPWHYQCFSFQFFMTLVKFLFNDEVKYLLIKDYPPLIFSLVIVSIICILIFGIMKQWEKCWDSYQLESFFDRNKKFIIACGLIFFISSLKLSLFILPYIVATPFLIWYIKKGITNVSLQDSQKALWFFLFCIGLAYCYQFFNNKALGGPVLSLICDGVIVSLLLFWFSIIKIQAKKQQYVSLCIVLMVLIPSGLVFGARFAKKQSIIAYFDLPYFIEHKYPRIILDDVDFESLKKQSKDFYVYQKDKSSNYNDLYSSILGKKMMAHQNVYDERKMHAIRFIFPEDKMGVQSTVNIRKTKEQ